MYYASRIKNLKTMGSKKWEIHKQARKKIEAGEDIIELTIGEPDLPTPAYLVDECYRSINSGRTKYSNGRGEAGLLGELEKKYNAKAAVKITNKNIVCFPGTQTALYAVMNTLVEHGDDVLVGDPFYATYEGIIASTGATLIPVPLKADKSFIMEPLDLKSRITKTSKVLLLNNPHNPTGSVMTKENLLKLGKICLQYNLWIVCDEVYEELIFNKTFVSPLNIISLAQRTIVVSSISKSHAAPGFRSGWTVGPKVFCDAILPLAETILFGNQPFIADMTALALSKPSEVSAKMKQNYENRAKLICQTLKNTPLVTALMPESGMFILIDISATKLSCQDFALGLLDKQKVAVMPGDSFGHEAKSFIRLSLTVPDKILAIACQRISSFVKNHCQTV